MIDIGCVKHKTVLYDTLVNNKYISRLYFCLSHLHYKYMCSCLKLIDLAYRTLFSLCLQQKSDLDKCLILLRYFLHRHKGNNYVLVIL